MIVKMSHCYTYIIVKMKNVFKEYSLINCWHIILVTTEIIRTETGWDAYKMEYLFNRIPF